MISKALVGKNPKQTPNQNQIVRQINIEWRGKMSRIMVIKMLSVYLFDFAANVLIFHRALLLL